MNKKIIIVGGGASGIVAAIAAARTGAQVMILEKMDRIGKKILATGNGRCNFTNINCRPADLNSQLEGFPQEVLTKFGVEQTMAFFNELGILPRVESEGRAYPLSEQASSVLDVLRMELDRLKIKVVCSSPVNLIERKKEGFSVYTEDGTQYKCNTIILATGGKAGAQYGCHGDGYSIAQKFGHSLALPRPALVQLLSNEWFFKRVKGVRTKGEVQLICDGKEVERERGEIQFTEDGLSGICIFNLSYQAGACIEQKGKCVICIDFFPDNSFEDLKDMLYKRAEVSSHKSAEEFLIGMLNKKLIPVILKVTGIKDPAQPCDLLKTKELDKITEILKGWPIPIQKLNTWKDAQVTAGGINSNEIDPSTLESKIVRGLYFCGEVLDVNGRCGGYNLQWAWSSGYVAGTEAAKRERG